MEKRKLLLNIEMNLIDVDVQPDKPQRKEYHTVYLHVHEVQKQASQSMMAEVKMAVVLFGEY